MTDDIYNTDENKHILTFEYSTENDPENGLPAECGNSECIVEHTPYTREYLYNTILKMMESLKLEDVLRFAERIENTIVRERVNTTLDSIFGGMEPNPENIAQMMTMLGGKIMEDENIPDEIKSLIKQTTDEMGVPPIAVARFDAVPNLPDEALLPIVKEMWAKSQEAIRESDD